MHKILKLVLIFVVLGLIMILSVFADSEKTVYVKDGSSGIGTKDSPYGSFVAAVDALDGNGGTIVIVDSITVYNAIK